jgi:hypothetical protein
LLKGFGVSDEVVIKIMEPNGQLVAENDIHLDEDHPPAEALNCNIMSIKCHLNPDAWKKVIDSCMYVTKTKQGHLRSFKYCPLG